MKDLLSIIFIFLSTQYFVTPLKGKELLCKIKNNYK